MQVLKFDVLDILNTKGVVLCAVDGASKARTIIGSMLGIFYAFWIWGSLYYYKNVLFLPSGMGAKIGSTPPSKLKLKDFWRGKL